MRILITGASGSGTTSLGRELAGIRGWDFFDADDYYWIPTDPPYTEKRDHSRRMAKILNDLSLCSNAVVSGSIMNWGLELVRRFFWLGRVFVSRYKDKSTACAKERF